MAGGRMKAHPKGKSGEDYAVKILLEEGYIIQERNFSSRFGEIDIIAEKDGIIEFIEVKTRKRGSMVAGAESVTPAKIRRIIRMAEYYLYTHRCDLQPRFDVFSAVTDSGEIAEHLHLEGAFEKNE